ncbi:Cytochrome P450 [Mycena sanguinolenta]|uniref:Cytochrome P450 n=1 Tax=Mycena sanguinolenta TaxID=230812 RepID=A0A8H6Y3P5_9AGAR|nr:Cytochrome P450 [Mycena sanguinolenta]
MVSNLLIGGVVVVGCFLRLLNVGRREHGLPPGPPTVPFWGNLHLIPAKQRYLKFMEWSRQYGEIFSIKIGPYSTVFLSSPTAIKEVVDKNSWSASFRAPNSVAELAAGGYHILLAPDTTLLRNVRRILMRFFSPSNGQHLVPVQTAESVQLLYELTTRPEVCLLLHASHAGLKAMAKQKIFRFCSAVHAFHRNGNYSTYLTGNATESDEDRLLRTQNICLRLAEDAGVSCRAALAE